MQRKEDDEELRPYSRKKDYYAALGIVLAASLQEIKRAFRRMSLRWHPDKWASLAAMLAEAEAEQLKALTEGMFRAVSRAKDRGFLPQRWAAQAGA